MRKPYSSNFDDSSSEEDFEIRDPSEDWEKFKAEVLPDLTTRINLSIKDEKSESKGTPYFILSSIQQKKPELVELLAKTIKEISISLGNLNSEFESEVPIGKPTKQTEKKYDISQLKLVISNKHLKIKGIVDAICELYNVAVKKIGDISEILDISVYTDKDGKRYSFKLSTQKKYTYTIGEFDELESQQFNILKEWFNSEKNQINSLLANLNKAYDFIFNIDNFLQSPILQFDEKICALSFVSHYMGIQLLHHPQVVEKYKKDKEIFLKNDAVSENFFNKVLASRVLETVLNELNSIFYQMAGFRPISYEAIFFPLIQELSEKRNLRAILKKVNQLNDYLLFREIYSYIDTSKTSFSEFIKKGSDEILELLEEKYPVISLGRLEANFINYNVDEFELENNKIQIKKNGNYFYKNFKGFLDLVYFHEENEIRNLIISSHLPRAVYTIYEICKIRKFTSLKKYYLEDNDDHLIEDTLRLISSLQKDTDMHVKLKSNITENDYEEIKKNDLIIIQKVTEPTTAHQIFFREFYDDYRYILLAGETFSLHLLTSEKSFKEGLCWSIQMWKSGGSEYTVILTDGTGEKFEQIKITCTPHFSELFGYSITEFPWSKEKDVSADTSKIVNFNFFVLYILRECKASKELILYYEIITADISDWDKSISSKDQRYLRAELKAYIEETCSITLSKSEQELFDENIKNPAFFAKTFLCKREEVMSIPGQKILEHTFLLILRKFFYEKCQLERTSLPNNFKFTTYNSASFLSNIHLCNRSLTRQSRNLLQDPNTQIQINVMNSGSEELSIFSKIWHFAFSDEDEFNEHSFFAVDKQILNSKRSEKRKDMLSREHHVAKIGAYTKIRSDFLEDKYVSKGNGVEIADLIRRPVALKKKELEFSLSSTVPLPSPSKQFYFSSLAYLLFGVESMRNPAMLILNHMLLDLLKDGHIQVEQLFGGSGSIKIRGSLFTFIFGLMPTAPKTVTARSRELNNLYCRYMPLPYIYPGDLARNSSQQPSSRDTETKLKVTLNHLIYRESLVMKMWFTSKGFNLDAMQLSEIFKAIKVAFSSWWDFDCSPEVGFKIGGGGGN